MGGCFGEEGGEERRLIMSLEPIVLEFDNRLAEHLAAERVFYRSTRSWKMDKVVAVLLLGMGIYGVLVVGPRWWTLGMFPLAVLEWFNLLSIRPLQIRYFFKRNPKLHERYRLGFTDAGIDFKTASLESKVAWTHYARFLESRELVLLIYGTRMYTVIPKRAFAAQEQYERFMALIRANVGSRGLQKDARPA